MLSPENKKYPFLLILGATLAAAVWIAFALLPWSRPHPGVDLSAFPVPEVIRSDSSTHQLTIQRYRQIGPEIRLLAYTPSSGIAPFAATVAQGDRQQEIVIPPSPGSWLRLTVGMLETGPFYLTLKSLKDSLCSVTVALQFDRERAGEIADTARWFRHGSDDDMLDVRAVIKNGKYYLKDFAGYDDGRKRYYFLEGMRTDSLNEGLEVRPGYLYTIVARWIDGPYDQWWNKTKYRSSRLQSVWIEPDSAWHRAENRGRLLPVAIPGWFRPSQTFNPQFDRIFPEFEPVPGKLMMAYRLNHDIPFEAYVRRGITHLPRWEQDVPAEKQHWTEAPGFFGDRDQQWFESLSRSEVEEYADRVGTIGAYAYDFEFWNRRYSPGIRQRLLWFSRKLKQNNPEMYLFDYWGGSAYVNTTFRDKDGNFTPAGFLRDYASPRSNHFNLEKSSDGDFFGRYFNITAVDVYPRPPVSVGVRHYSLNNYLILSAVHSSRINRMFDYQQNNKTVWFAWNRFMPMYDDPPFPWHVRTTNPEGSLIFSGLETIPASQALSISLFSLVEGDGLYIWNDSQAWGKGPNNYSIRDNTHLHAPTIWLPADGRSDASRFSVDSSLHESPRYWDYASDFFALGNWMAHQAGDILHQGKRGDLPFCFEGQWHEPQKEQAVLAAHYRFPFVTSVTNGNRILVLALDSFQQPNQTRSLRIRLPDGSEAEIELYGNWPSLYRGVLTR